MTPTEHLLRRQLADLAPALVTKLQNAGFNEDQLLSLASTLGTEDAAERRRQRNVIAGELSPASSADIATLPTAGSSEHQRLASKGRLALSRGELAFCVMAGGMATRMGGVVKALVEAIRGHSFLKLRLMEQELVSMRAGCNVPLWIMTSEATHAAIERAVAAEAVNAPIRCFVQQASLRLTPEGTLFLGEQGEPSVYATGHGDLVDALRRANLLSPFVAAGGKYVWVTNIDNLGATIDEAVLGAFVEQVEQHQAELMFEVCTKAGDRGGIPVRSAGRVQIVEEFRLPASFDASSVNVFNTNTFLARADLLSHIDVPWTYFEVEKRVDDRTAIQFERLIQEMTAYAITAYLHVPREGKFSRFLPVKDPNELARRQHDIEQVLSHRGLLSRSAQ